MKLYYNSSSSSPAILATFCLTIIVVTLSCSPAGGIVQTPNGEKIPAVIVFGDSIVDTGNNNKLLTAVKSNFLPYGENFMGGKPTGRFCDGKVPADLIAEQLGVKDVVPAYKDPALKDEDLPTGVSFASGGSGYDPLTPKLVSVVSLPEQLKMFEEYKERLRRTVGENTTNDIISRSLYLVVTGSDDIANTYYLVQKTRYDINSYTDLMLKYGSQFYQALYGLGARRVAIFSLPPLGCLPSRRTLSGGLERKCVQSYNEAAMLFNAKLMPRLDSLNRRLPRARLVYINIYTPLLDLIERPQENGFKVVNKGCCGTGTAEVAVLCNQADPTTCTNPSDYLFWDSYHPTEKAYNILSSQLINQYVNSFFFCGATPCA